MKHVAYRLLFVALIVLLAVPVTLGAPIHDVERTSWIGTITEWVSAWLPSSENNSSEDPEDDSKPRNPSEDQSGSTNGPGIDPNGGP